MQIRLYISLLFQLLGGQYQLFVPCFAEASCQRFLQKAVYRQSELSALLHGSTADVPAVVVECGDTACQCSLADRVEGAAYGLAERAAVVLAIVLAVTPPVFLEHTEAAAVLMAREHAVLAAHYACHESPLNIGVSHSLTVYDVLRRSRQSMPHIVEHVFYFSHLVERYRCTGIAFHAACAVAGIKVAAEALRQYVRRDQNAANIYYR